MWGLRCAVPGGVFFRNTGGWHDLGVPDFGGILGEGLITRLMWQNSVGQLGSQNSFHPCFLRGSKRKPRTIDQVKTDDDEAFAMCRALVRVLEAFQSVSVPCGERLR